MCNNDRCILEELACDGFNHCDDNSDELGDACSKFKLYFNTCFRIATQTIIPLSPESSKKSRIHGRGKCMTFFQNYYCIYKHKNITFKKCQNLESYKV